MEAEESRKRRRYAAELKAQILAECDVPGASVAKVAMAYGINANVVHKWLAGIGMKRSSAHLPTASPAPVALPQFLPVAINTNNSVQGVPALTQEIRLDLDLGAVQIKLNCSRDSAPSAAALLHAVAEMVARA